ncbi:MAG: NUDIX hydrolase [Acidobacteriota bacterium]|nr:NUDIX hydrolase [Acidobacteriota bacterium]
MPIPHGPWIIHNSTEQYRDKWLNVQRDDVTKPDGEPGKFAFIKLLPGVSVLALDDEGGAHLTSEFRYAVGRDSVEVVSGAIDEGEEPHAAARRELREELGIEAEEWIDLGWLDPLTSQLVCPVNLYLARGLTFSESEREGTELIEAVTVLFDEAVSMVMDSRITHAPSCALILKASEYLRVHPRDRQP